MKRNSATIIAALIPAVVVAAILLSQPAVRSDQTIGTRLWNSYEDFRLRHVVPPQTFSGMIEGLSSTNDSFLLSITDTCGLPIVVDPEQAGPFWDGSVKAGDWVSVSVRTRVSGSRKYGQYYLQKIHVDFAGPRHAALAQPLPDFSQPVRLSITPQGRSSGLALSAMTELRSDSLK